MARHDEYDDIYDVDSCFVFQYSNRKLGKSKVVDATMFDHLPAAKHNTEGDSDIYIFCSKCSEYMDFVQGDPYALNGHWICPYCKARVREQTPYLQLGRENRKWLDRYELTDDYIDSGYDPDECDWSDL